VRIVLVPSGMAWLDSEIGGFPEAGVVAVVGDAGCGKTSLALGFALASLKRGRTCFVTNDSPEALLEASSSLFEQDPRPHLQSGRLTLLRFTPYFGNKVRSLASVDAPLSELGQLVVERQIEHVIFDTFDPMVGWVEPTNASTAARSIMGTLQRWGVSVLCTMSGTAPTIFELARAASGCLELASGEIFVHHAGWCNVRGKGAPVDVVQGRGLVVRTTLPPPVDPDHDADGPCSSLITDSKQKLRVDQQEWDALWDDLSADGPPSQVDLQRAAASMRGAPQSRELHEQDDERSDSLMPPRAD
jgi:KaiC/GvpD/RAD55 family RecA-like ATPase